MTDMDCCSVTKSSGLGKETVSPTGKAGLPAGFRKDTGSTSSTSIGLTGSESPKSIAQQIRERNSDGGVSPLKMVASMSGSSPPPTPPAKNGASTESPAASGPASKMKERLGKQGLSISTGKSQGFSVQTGVQRAKDFRELSEADFQKEYKLLSQVMESTNTGMSVLFAKRASDKLKVVIKIRDRKSSFKRQSDENEWKATTLAQLAMPQMDTICKYYDCVATPKNYYVVMERVQGQDLFEELCRDKNMDPNHAREIIFQILEALKNMHNVGRIHKDLKLENVMVDMNADKEPSSPGGKNSLRKSVSSMKSVPSFGSAQSPKTPGVKLIDFDTVTDWEPGSPKTRDVLGSDGYIAPEAYGGEYSPASDIYQVGVIMYKLLTRKFPHDSSIFDDKPGENWVGSPAMKRVQENLKKQKIDFTRSPLDRMPTAVDLCRKMLNYEPNERPTAEQVLEHDWFKMDEALGG